MLRCREVNLKLNPKKFQFKVKQVTWMGHLLSSTGITPHPDRVQAIKDPTARCVVIHSDHQPLETIFKKPLSKAPRRLQRMVLQFTVVYKKGKYIDLADTLSRAALNLPTPSDPQEEVFQCISGDAPEMFRVELETMALDSPNMYPSTLEEIKAETEADPTPSVLCGFEPHGWPSDKSQVPTALRHYYRLRDELAVYHGVLYKSHKVLLPVKLQSTMLKKLHHGHQGGESMIRRAREVMYWPELQTAILQDSAKCSLCASYGLALPKEPMLSHEIPQGPWKFISQDLFKQGGRWYSVTVDHYSDLFEVGSVNEDITTANVISVTKAHFARYCIPDTFL